MKVVFFQGTFDILNAGHVRAFELARSHGDMLVVGLNTDALVRRDKSREPILPYSQRAEIVAAIRWVDKVIPCDQEQALPYLMAWGADVFVLTEEWRHRHLDTGIKWIEDKGGKVVYSPRWPDILCSSDIRAAIRATGT